MGSNVIIGIVIGLVILAAALYLIGYLMKKKNQDRLKELDKRKEALFDLPVVEEVDEVKKMHLVGQSQNTFREWNQKWTDVSTKSFAELESQIFEVESQNETFRFMKGKSAIESAERTMTEMEEEVEGIRTGLKELRETEERNSLAVQQALDVFEELKKDLKEKKDSFGPALPEIQKQVKNVEIEFTQFVTLNTSGDPIEAREVLDDAEKHTYEVQATMQKVPTIYEDLEKTFPSQIDELEKTYKKMMADNFVLPEDDFEARLEKVKKHVERSLEDLEKIELSTVETANKETAELIDDLYDVLEKEFEAKKYVMTNRKTIGEYIAHASRNNHQLMVELDHTSQSYALNNNELGRARGFQTEIEELERRNRNMDPQIDKHELPYSEVQVFYKDAFKVLDDIETKQVEIDDDLHDLRKGEKEASAKIEKYEFRLRNLKRYVEQQRLPGLPGDYLEFFFVATDRVEELSKSLNKIRINMQDINKLVSLCDEDMEMLDQKTYDLVDAAALTEQMMQYANRYRHTHPEIKSAIENSLELFNKEYRYQDALDEIGTALERVEPGAFKRIEDFYFNNRDLV
ncbi:septation ring formation regulator EzrA [Enterococcus hulanensis]|uniref:Septation ring formation regulator EzrA n=1 Tax=Enterococcus hulanensis TaxID=2559929 RepID=A0ABU3F312_9ENTE|nr:septation ring formation regulator EzrA [Enterococcus hulanensis]MDT2601514.1 septation ring formation regulator EzrA [Enterococcus hulanensis]MDT2610943.1 septation ring formation regulator EzrA [Enterococcus hulanensis]MDT2618348.1 septation ring formation regulator EzrA [Enterococcus hulanensis]MDT2629449.1 septation ring formation regulator EzrA [Enterococcus hulanensis]MDT2657011.1 septation ring formation regulator EzrA [Enterococcus hulanensis]